MQSSEGFNIKITDSDGAVIVFFFIFLLSIFAGTTASRQPWL
jgi:hypothetical protein